MFAWVGAFGFGVPYWPDGRMLRAMIVGSFGALASAFPPAASNSRTAPSAITTRRIPPSPLSSAARPLLDRANGNVTPPRRRPTPALHPAHLERRGGGGRHVPFRAGATIPQPRGRYRDTL